ncbi:hypothetical protein K431DRAFT_221415 [Polychaeton citri CBS 116435]|uniref:Nephrocystin 3-like N-terminal domain-containing protein n=1 Tax=Polychaeton citri CBS 116435 TaxID=1314669 RepID=A0A9P4QDD1_9PEZI|nr:hypothetical protein K431DRAFT_221415 [Polychaeton citri CBS 116435]
MSGSTVGEVSTNHLLSNTAQVLEKRTTAELGMGVAQSISSLSFIELVEYLRAERLSSLPHKGSKWDNVLIKALYFAQQLHNFEVIIKGFGTDEASVPSLGYGFTRLLLELGHENASALDTAFDVLYKHSLEVSALLHRTEVLTVTTPQTREQLCLLYGDLLTLSSSVASRYYKVVHGMASPSTSLDINDVCGDVVRSFHERKSNVIELIWAHQANISGTNLDSDVSIQTLQRWLSPTDRLLTTISEDFSMHLEGQAEFTCLWFQKQLISFIQNSGKVMAITGPEGSGKTVLSASIAERLQRAIGRQQCATLYYSINSEVPSTANPINILKSLLRQLFNLRIGNMQTYHAVVRAYESSRFCHKPEEFVEHLWEALDECFKKPMDKAKEVVVLVNGLDAIKGGKTASQTFFEKLAETTCDGKAIKLIGLARTLSLPSGIDTTHVQVDASQIKEDLHAVILRGLLHCHNLTKRPGQEQEQIINKVAQASHGSFVVANLLAESLNRQKSSDDFSKLLKSLESAKPSTEDLVLSTTSWYELSDVSRMVLTWLVTAERPLATSEIQALLTAGVQDTSNAHKDVDIESSIEPLKAHLTFYGGIIRFKNHITQRIVTGLLDHNKITTPIKARHNDFLLRILNATKKGITEDGDPTFEESDPDTLESDLHKKPLVQYTLNYWTLLVTRIGESKLPQELSKALPTTAVFPMYERTLWSHHVPLIQLLEYTKVATNVRQATFKDSNYSVLQSRLNVAIVYELLQKPDEAAPIYFAITKIARSVMSEHHPLAIECGHRFLAITESKVTTSRTEIMTMREETIQILISLYERQFGNTSQQVIEMKTILAEFYTHIHEEQKATELYQQIKQTTIQLYGHSSNEARDASDHLKVVLGRAKTDKIQPRAETIFDEDDDEEDEAVVDIVDISHVDRLIAEAKTERQLVELWQKVALTCRSSNSLEWHERNIQVAQAYASHLSSHKRSTEASAVLASTAREYSSSQMMRSESIVNRLTEVAASLKTMKAYSAALSIFKRTAEYYSSHHKHESSQMIQIQREISAVSSEVIQSGSTQVSLEEVYRSLVTNETKTIDNKVMQLAHTIVTAYMEHSRLADATEMVLLALHRTWPSWLTIAPKDVVMPILFPNESIELVKLLAQCYIRMRHIETAEIVYSKLLHAVLSPKSPDFNLLKAIQQLLVDHYDRYNHSEKSITTLQKVLTVYKIHIAPDNDAVINILYDLGARTRKWARTYPFWIEYYRQIVSTLNKDSDVVHPRAFEATLIVAISYWDDRRYTEAVSIYGIIWNTFIQKQKQITEFTREDFVTEIYERYIASLEQTGASYDTIYQVSVRHRTTCITAFGAQSTTAARATVSLAEICASNESHSTEALKWYEDVHKHSNSVLSERKWQIADALTSLYSREVITQTSRSVDATTLESARARTSEQYASAVSKYGYAHESSLKSLHEVATLYHRQQKVDAIQKELTKATTEVITRETSADQMLQAAESIVQTYQACQMTSQCGSLVTELHRQIIAGDKRNVSKAGFDVTKSGKGALSLLVAMMCTLDASLSYSQLLAELSVEMALYESYRKVVDSNESLQIIIMNASTLRAFLTKTERTELVECLDNDISALFITRDGSKMELLSQKSARIFIVGIMEYLGVRRSKNFVKAVILASNHRLNQLIASEQYTEAYDIAKLSLTFALYYDGYNSPKGISYGFNLASTLVGIGTGKKTSNAELRKKMLQLSNEIVKKVLDVCKKQGISFGQIQLRELSRLVSLLGEQEDYETLEWLLTTLWNTREAQSTWPSQVLHTLARRLISARYLSGHPIKALRLCEDVAYNMRRTHGAGHPATREINLLLAQLYTSSGQYYLQNFGKDKSSHDLAAQYFAKALQVHEDMLCLLINDSDNDGHDDDDDVDSTGAILAAHGVQLGNGPHSQINGSNGATQIDQGASAREHVHLLKLAHQRLGSWPKSYGVYERLLGQVYEVYPAEMKDVARPDKWQVKGFGGGKAESDKDAFVKEGSWQLLDQKTADQHEMAYA